MPTPTPEPTRRGDWFSVLCIAAALAVAAIIMFLAGVGFGFMISH